MLLNLYLAAATTTTKGGGSGGGGSSLDSFVQSAVTVLISPLGWLLLLGLIVGGVICFMTRKYGAFALDFVFAILLGWLIFNPTVAENLLHSSSGGIH